MKSIAFTFLFALGCSKDSDDTSADATISGPTHTVWSGWNHTWGMLSHRVSLIDVRTGEGDRAHSGILGGDWSTGDTWSDDVNHRIHQQHITGDQLLFEQGSITLSVGPGETASGSAAVAMESPNLAVLQGFTINTDTAQTAGYPDDYDPALGYTSRGFGFAVALNDSNEVVATANVDWGPRDRDDMNRAIEHATTEVTVHYAVLSGFDDVDTATYSGTQDLAHDPPNSPQAALTEPLGWAGNGIAAIQSFGLSLHDTDGGDGGDYLRSFGVEMKPAATGGPPASVETGILTYSALELGIMSMTAETDIVWIPLDAKRNRIEGVSVEGSHPVGTYSVPHEAGP
jgi:hypothetical protein